MAENELKQGTSRFRLIGTVAPIGQNSLESAKLNKKGTWHTVNTSVGIDIDGKGNVVYARLFGGHSSQGRPILARPANADYDNFQMLEIPLSERQNEDFLSQVAYSDLLTTDVSGTQVQFLSMVDFVEHLREHLVEGMEVQVTGQVEYTTQDVTNMDKVYRNYNISGIYLNPTITDNETGEEKLRNEHGTQLLQTYLLTSDSLPDDWKKQLKDEKEFVIGAYVPQYISSTKDKHTSQYVPYKKTIAMPQALVVRVGDSDDGFIKLTKQILEIKDDDVVRKINFRTRINEGYETSTGEVHISKELQKLIDDGLMTEEDVKGDVTVRGQRTRELIIENIKIERNADGEAIPWEDEIYDYSVLQVPEPKASDDSSGYNTINKEVKEDKAEEKVESSDLDSVFSDFDDDETGFGDDLEGLFV